MCSALRFWRSVYFDSSPRGMGASFIALEQTSTGRFRSRPEHPGVASVEPQGSRNGENQMATQTLERRETASLIGSDKVEGTNVYRSNGDKIGSIERIMLDK